MLLLALNPNEAVLSSFGLNPQGDRSDPPTPCHALCYTCGRIWKDTHGRSEKWKTGGHRYEVCWGLAGRQQAQQLTSLPQTQPHFSVDKGEGWEPNIQAFL